MFNSIEICAGAGGQALGLEQAGFQHQALLEIDNGACNTLLQNRPSWNVLHEDVNNWDAQKFAGVDLFAGGVPCPPFSKAGMQLGEQDERDLFSRALELIEQVHPRAVMLENVRGLLDPKFDGYREHINDRLKQLGYVPSWRLLHASDYGVSQLRPRVVCVALPELAASFFHFPEPLSIAPKTVGQLLFDQMSSRGWQGANAWARKANHIAPTLVGGSKKHGGPDLGPTRARQAWATLGVDGSGIADEAPAADFPSDAMPKLTPQMCARIQGFPGDWVITGRKTAAYRQIGNAFPPPVARAVGLQIVAALSHADAHMSVMDDSVKQTSVDRSPLTASLLP